MNIDRGALLHLLRKDAYLHRWAVLALLVVQMATAVSLIAQFPESMQSTAGSFLQGVGSIGTFVMAYRLTAAAEQAGVIGYLKSLPLTNDEIFASRFVALTSYVLVNALLLNLAFLAVAFPLGWVSGPPPYQAVLAGLLVQLVFGVLLLGVATLTSSEKAIWVPFPLVIALINGYAMAASSGSPFLSRLVANVQARWLPYSVSVALCLVGAAFLVVRLTRIKRTLIA